MQLHWGWAVVAALALGTGLAWWTQPANEHEHGRKADATDSGGHGSDRHKRSHGDAGPTLYRWVDDAGVVSITDRPPHGRPYTIVRIDPNRNIVPMSVGISSTRTTTRTASPPR